MCGHGLHPQGSLGALFAPVVGAWPSRSHRDLGFHDSFALLEILRLLEIGDRIGSIIQSREEDLILNGFLVDSSEATESFDFPRGESLSRQCRPILTGQGEVR